MKIRELAAMIADMMEKGYSEMEVRSLTALKPAENSSSSKSVNIAGALVFETTETPEGSLYLYSSALAPAALRFCEQQGAPVAVIPDAGPKPTTHPH